MLYDIRACAIIITEKYWIYSTDTALDQFYNKPVSTLTFSDSLWTFNVLYALYLNPSKPSPSPAYGQINAATVVDNNDGVLVCISYS